MGMVNLPPPPPFFLKLGIKSINNHICIELVVKRFNTKKSSTINHVECKAILAFAHNL